MVEAPSNKLKQSCVVVSKQKKKQHM